MLPWVERPTLKIDLDKPALRRFDGMPPDALAAGERLLAAVSESIPKGARMLAHAVRLRTLNRFHEEVVSLSRRIHADWRDVMLANISYDLLIATFGCSTIALATPGGPVVARNMDWWPEDILAQASYLVQYQRRGTLQFANAGWPGATGVVTGMSSRGFAVVLNAVTGPEGHSRLGYPVLLHLRRVLEDAPDFEAARKWLCEQRLTVPALFTLVGTENHQRVIIERTPSRFAERRPKGDGPLFVTNDYRLLFQPETREGPEIYQSTCSRYDALCEFFADHRPDRDIGDEELLYRLTDPRVIQGITAQHIIMRPRQQTTRLFVPRRLLNGKISIPPMNTDEPI
jgi:isopenicillin-N N-acyltransferase like protein